jgi:uncharacterized protein
MIDDWSGRRPCRPIFLLTALLLFSLWAVTAQAEEIGQLYPSHPDEPPLWSSPLLFFQRVISRADGDRCPMHPSCSHYAATVFKRYNPITAWILTCDRLLRCGHDEMRTAPQVLVNGAPHAYDPVEANTFWWRDP